MRLDALAKSREQGANETGAGGEGGLQAIWKTIKLEVGQNKRGKANF